MEEIWKAIEGYEGLYEISNIGNVRSVDRYIHKVERGTPCVSFCRGRILSPGDNGKGYQFVLLNYKGKSKSYYIHRLVAMAFIPRVKGKDYINHKDGNKKRNNVDNLEWCTTAENNEHKMKVIKHFTSLLGRSNVKNRKKIGLFKNGVLVEKFDSLKEASVKLHLNYNNISMICNGKRVSTYDIRKI